MNPGVSFATTTFFPSRRSANSRTAATTAGSVSAVGITSSSGRYRGGLKKCVPSQCPRKSSLRPSARPAIDKPDVLELTMEPARRRVSTRSRRERFASACSMTASMIQSACAIHSKSESNPPVRMRLDCVGRKKRIGFELARPLESLARGLRGNVEQRDRVAGVAQMSAICAPIVPAPSTQADRILSEADGMFRHVTLSSHPPFNLEVISMARRIVLALAACCLVFQPSRQGRRAPRPPISAGRSSINRRRCSLARR